MLNAVRKGGEKRLKKDNDLRKGFTLIELLIVVAIIGILAAIAVPNFLMAQTRAKVARTFADMRTVSIAVETYRVDHNVLPAPWPGDPVADQLIADVPNPFNNSWRHVGILLTTPTEYLSSIPIDPWISKMTVYDSFEWGAGDEVSFIFVDYVKESAGWDNGSVWFCDSFWAYECPGVVTYSFTTCGPDMKWWNVAPVEQVYDPTNGTISSGDIWAFDGPRLFPRQ
jgi:type II secretion system protein G